ncbi:hypothetical protein ACH5RR_002253 [Cinchona calisaya]|uniref:Cyclin-dependent kinase inhibitor n=1 Tax=Cinchona calisaya TaxID=153742 RepID=A0ABD3B719_9GENT
MGEYLKKCEKSVAEMAMDVVGTGGMFKMRVAQEEEEEEEEVTSSSKRRKVLVYEDDDSPELLLVNLPPENSASVSTANSTTSEEKNIKSADLKDSETEISTFNITKFSSRERSPSSSEVCGVESAELMLSSSTTKKKSSYTRNSRIKSSVPAAELEDFFAVFEKQEHQRFAQKYNYDVVKDVPLEGRYHWIRLKP